MHSAAPSIDIEKAINAQPFQPAATLRKALWLAVLFGVTTFFTGILSGDAAHTWFCFYWALIYFMGLAAGGVIISAIFQITRATWSASIRRLTEANVAFLPVAFILFLATYVGRQYLFPWARSPRPGTEWWMQPGFVYVRMGLLLGILFFFMWRFVRLSLRGDIGMAKDHAKDPSRWYGFFYNAITERWRGLPLEVSEIQNRLSQRAPALALVYAIVYSLFAFEMVMAMDYRWMSNLFGGFMFIGNIYGAWAILTLLTLYHVKRDKVFAEWVTTNELWDLGKLTFGFCMVWGYFFFSQFLPQWYGNLPEETQYLILRTREFPWKGFAWVTLAACFIVPFILLLSRDLKKTPRCIGTVSVLILIGLAMERYLLVMPQFSPGIIPFGVTEVGIFLGIFGLYGLSLQGFLASVPPVVISSPLAHGSADW